MGVFLTSSAVQQSGAKESTVADIIYTFTRFEHMINKQQQHHAMVLPPRVVCGEHVFYILTAIFCLLYREPAPGSAAAHHILYVVRRTE